MGERRRVGVVGVGHLGALHAQKYSAHPGVELAAVYDSNAGRRAEVARAQGCTAAPSLEALLDQVDAVSVAVPTAAHLDTGMRVVEAGIDMLIEKPMAAGADEAGRLAAAAAERGVIVQVGHLERFNPVFEDMRSLVAKPRFIECHRLSPFAGRGDDTNVVYDVMIHDLDIISLLVGTEVESIDAVGVAVLSGHADIANVRLRMAGGCTANVTASRVSLKRERKMRIFQEDAYVSLDFDARTMVLARRDADAAGPDPMSAISIEERDLDDGDPLAGEIAEFIDCVTDRRAPSVGTREGIEALELADRVLAAMEACPADA